MTRGFYRSDPSGPLGPLELRVMEIVWSRERASVRDIVGVMDATLAYTTVMTTLDRLYKKGFLDRLKQDRAFFYTPRVSRIEWERQRAGRVIEEVHSRELLLSCLLDQAADSKMLDEFEERIRQKRRELMEGQS